MQTTVGITCEAAASEIHMLNAMMAE
ncbi:unnamed protein product, partial [Rotaria magnacalcarata]